MAVEHRKHYKEKKFNYFYKITNDFDDCYYYGIHSTNNMNDCYMGSGKRLRRAKKKHGIEHFICTPIKFFNTREEAAQYEFEFLTLEILSDPNCYNIAEGGGGGDATIGMSNESYELFCQKCQNGRKGKHWSNEERKKRSISMKGKHAGEKNPMFGRTGENAPMFGIHRYGENAPMYGKHHSDETRAKISKSGKGRPAPNKGKPGKTKGQKLMHIGNHQEYVSPDLIEQRKSEGWELGACDEFKKMRSEISKGKPSCRKGKTTGTHWYNNGIDEDMFLEGKQPEGWERGRLPMSEKQKRQISETLKMKNAS